MRSSSGSKAIPSALSVAFSFSCVVLGACGGGTPSPAHGAQPHPDPAPSAPATADAGVGQEQSAGPASGPVVVSAEIKAVVDAADRDAADKALDAGRKPGELLAFLGIQPGMKVADLGAGGGYTTELLERRVGPTGTVFMQNTKWIMDKFAEKAVTARLAKPLNKNVVKVVRDFADPLPPEANDLDAVVMVLIYHDTFWFDGGVDRAKMNAAVFKALKPGGVYAVVDHAGRAGTGSSEVQSLHRIDESVVKDEITKAGFKLAAEGSFLRNPNDKRDWNASPGAAGEKRGSSDRFVLKFVKP